MSTTLHTYFWLYLIMCVALAVLTVTPVYAQENFLGGGGTVRVAVGGILPITVKLTNFGSARRVDVEVTYNVLDAAGRIVLSETETVAVDTTASFVKQLQIPSGVPPGIYRAESAIQYPDQTAPATSGFSFTVERTFFGVFESDVLLYGGLTLVLVIAAFIVGRLFIRTRARRAIIHDYGDKPKDERIYYEIISDTIGQMRQRAGDRALEIALQTPGLMIDAATGRVMTINGSPAKVVAALISGYENALGKKASFSLRKGEAL